jgi:hypothetical protein
MAEPRDFLSLPPELRISIYEYVWPTPTADERTAEIDLINTEHPNGALTKTCRLIRNESRPLYTCWLRSYWPTRPFFIKLDAGSPTDFAAAEAKVRAMNSEMLCHIRHLKIAKSRPGDFVP